MSAKFNRTADGRYISSNLVPVEIVRAGRKWDVVIAAREDGTRHTYRVAGDFGTLADATTYALPLVNHPQGVAACDGFAAMAKRELAGFGGHARRQRFNERRAAYLTAWRSRRMPGGEIVSTLALGSEAASTLMPPRDGGDGWPYFVRADAHGAAMSAARHLTEDTSTDESVPPFTYGREHSGTEDGYLWYVLDARGERVPDHGGWMHEEDAAGDAAVLNAERDGFTVWAADGDRAAECIAAAVTHAKVTGSRGAVYSIGGDGTPESSATVRRTGDTPPEGHTLTLPGDGGTSDADVLARIAEHADGMREVSAGEYSADAAAYMDTAAAKLRDMLADAPLSVLADVPESTLALAGGEYVALSAVWAALARDGYAMDAKRMPLDVADAREVISWARDFATDCLWADVDADSIADMSDRSVVTSAARHYDGGMAAMCSDALALPRAERATNERAASGRTLREVDTYAAAAKLARDAVPGMLARADVAGTVHGTDTPRELAHELADVLADADGATAARMLAKLPDAVLSALVDVLNEGRRSVDVNRHEMATAMHSARTLAKLANGYLGRGADWERMHERVSHAADIARAIAAGAAWHARRNDSAYFSGDGPDMSGAGEPRAE